MILAISYADERFQQTQKFNTKRALKFGADKVLEYSYDTLSDEFKEKNKSIFKYTRGGGYWVWKPYIIRDALSIVQKDDYVVYTDAGSAFVQPMHLLIDAMNNEKTDVMAFCIDQIEIKYSKRDALILMDCDKDEIIHSPQICTGYIILRKTQRAVELIDQYLAYVQDRRIVTDEPNVLGKDNYPEFIENRHDQTVWSLLCKKNGIRPFRDPSEWGLDHSLFSDEVNERSPYPQVIESHRNPKLHYFFQLNYKRKWWYGIFRRIISMWEHIF